GNQGSTQAHGSVRYQRYRVDRRTCSSGGGRGDRGAVGAGAGAVACQECGWAAQRRRRCVRSTMVAEAGSALASSVIAFTGVQATCASVVQFICPPAVPLEPRKETLVMFTPDQRGLVVWVVQAGAYENGKLQRFQIKI